MSSKKNLHFVGNALDEADRPLWDDENFQWRPTKRSSVII